MIERTGNIFDTDATYIGHGVNVRGVMGAGIAKQFRDRYPMMYRRYKQVCNEGSLRPGNFWADVIWDDELQRQVVVVNLASQQEPGADATYLWLFGSLARFAKAASESTRLAAYDGLVALPEIGCGIGGLKWDGVKKMVEAVEVLYPEIEFEVWHYEG